MKIRIPSKKINQHEIVNTLTQAYFDYLAARVLLNGNHLRQGHLLASYSIERYFKSILLFRGNKISGHEISAKKFLNSLKNFVPEFYKTLNHEFLFYLEKAFEMRYWDNQRTFGNMLLFKNRTLYELDKMVHYIESCVTISSDGKQTEKFYNSDIKRQKKELLENNYFLNNIRPYDLESMEETIEFTALSPDNVLIIMTSQLERGKYNGKFPVNGELKMTATDGSKEHIFPKYPTAT